MRHYRGGQDRRGACLIVRMGAKIKNPGHPVREGEGQLEKRELGTNTCLAGFKTVICFDDWNVTSLATRSFRHGDAVQSAEN